MDETKKKLLAAESVEEVAQILKEAGEDEAKAEKVWQEACQLKEQMGQDLSLDELDAVAGGVTKRSWIKDGCAATVEPGSDCWGTDGGCMFSNINYDQNVVYRSCIYCGAPVTSEFLATRTGLQNSSRYAWECRECGREFYKNTAGEWVELFD